MKKLYLALLIAASSPAFGQDANCLTCSRLTRDLDNAKPTDYSAQFNIPAQPMPSNPAPQAPRNTGGWASCSGGVCNGFNNDGSSWWSSDAGGTIQYFYNQ